MSSTHKTYRKCHYQNISDKGGEPISLVGTVKNFDRANGKLFLEILGKDFEINNVESHQRINKGNIGKLNAVLIKS